MVACAVQPPVHRVHTSLHVFDIMQLLSSDLQSADVVQAAASTRFSSLSCLCWQLLQAEEAHGNQKMKEKLKVSAVHSKCITCCGLWKAFWLK